MENKDVALSVNPLEAWIFLNTVSPGVRPLPFTIKSQRGPLMLRVHPFCGLGQGVSPLGASVSPSVKWDNNT